MMAAGEAAFCALFQDGISAASAAATRLARLSPATDDMAQAVGRLSAALRDMSSVLLLEDAARRGLMPAESVAREIARLASSLKALPDAADLPAEALASRALADGLLRQIGPLVEARLSPTGAAPRLRLVVNRP